MDAGEALAARLLRAGRAEVAPAGSEERLLALTAVALGSASAAGGGVAGLHALLHSLNVGRWVLACSMTIGVGAAVVLGSPWHQRPSGVESVAAPVARPTGVANASSPAPVTTADVPPSDVAPKEMGRAPTPHAAPGPAAPRAAEARQRPQAVTRLPAASAVAPSPAPSLALDELGAVRRATLALKAGDPAAALAALDEHDGAARHGVYAEEALVVRISALVAAGDRAGAERDAAVFLRAFPRSPYAQRVRGMFFGADLP
jgi:hypothetical protein